MKEAFFASVAIFGQVNKFSGLNLPISALRPRINILCASNWYTYRLQFYAVLSMSHQKTATPCINSHGQPSNTRTDPLRRTARHDNGSIIPLATVIVHMLLLYVLSGIFSSS